MVPGQSRTHNNLTKHRNEWKVLLKGQKKDRVDLFAERGNFKGFTRVKRPSYMQQKWLALDANTVKLNNLTVRDRAEGGVEGPYFP